MATCIWGRTTTQWQTPCTAHRRGLAPGVISQSDVAKQQPLPRAKVALPMAFPQALGLQRVLPGSGEAAR